LTKILPRHPHRYLVQHRVAGHTTWFDVKSYRTPFFARAKARREEWGCFFYARVVDTRG